MQHCLGSKILYNSVLDMNNKTDKNVYVIIVIITIAIINGYIVVSSQLKQRRLRHWQFYFYNFNLIKLGKSTTLD